MDSCAAIVLAAGASSRLGRPKQLIQVDGESLLRRTVRLATDAGCNPIFVVLGCGSDACSAEIEDLNVDIVVNPDWHSGMASSLRSGLQAALQLNPLQENTMVLVCDQPKLDPKLLQNLLATHLSRQVTITAAKYGETLGVPAVFSKAVFGELLDLTGDQGARRILMRLREQVAVVEFPGGEVDLDTPDDLATLGL